MVDEHGIDVLCLLLDWGSRVGVAAN
jgi:hypothetical protein